MPTDFWETARVQLESVKPDLMMLAEASKPELLVKAFDVDYSWPLMGTLNDVLIKGAPATNLRASWEDSERQFPRNALHMRVTDDHDEPRAVARFGVRGAWPVRCSCLRSMACLCFTTAWKLKHDATESGDPALFDKLPIFWSPKDRPPLREIYRSLIQLRKDNAAFRNGQVVWLRNSNEGSLVAFKRSDGTNEFVVLVNFSNRPLNGQVEIDGGGEFKAVHIAGTPQIQDHDFPSVHLQGFDWRIYHRDLGTVAHAAGVTIPVEVGSAH